MLFEDFICDDCGHIQTARKKSIHTNWSDVIVLCEKCEKKMRRKLSAPAIDVAKGNFGNSANGYENSLTYKRSTKYGMYKGKKV